MFKYLLVVLVFWCQVQEHASDQNEEPESDTTKLLSLSQNSDTQVSNETAGEIREKPRKNENGITMNGHTNYHVEIGQQIFYIYDEQQVKRLLSNIISDDKNNAVNDINVINNNNNNSKQIPKDYFITQGIGAHKLHFNKMTWNKARQTCIQEGGHLAIINSESEEKVLLQKLEENNVINAWLGLHDFFEEGYWITVNGEPLESTGYNKWTTAFSAIEPNNAEGRQHCATLVKYGGMDDFFCTESIFFFCEIPM